MSAEKAAFVSRQASEQKPHRAADECTADRESELERFLRQEHRYEKCTNRYQSRVYAGSIRPEKMQA